MSIKLNIKPVNVILGDFGLEPYGEGQQFFAGACRARMNARYVPEDTKTLIDESYVDGECNIVYDQEYASIQYHGIIWGHQVPEGNYSKPGTGPYWDQKMISAEGDELVKDMAKYIKERG